MNGSKIAFAFLLIAVGLIVSGLIGGMWADKFEQVSEKRLENKAKFNSDLLSGSITLKTTSVIDLSSNKPSEQKIYVPFFPKTASSELYESSVYPEGSTKRNKPKRVKRAKKEPSENKSTKLSKSPSPSILKLTWTGAGIVDFAEREITSDHKWIRPMNKKNSSFNTYFAFFNETRLEKQIKKDEQSYKNYQARWERGKIVAPDGETGIKRLSEPYPVATIDGKCRVFKWELKTINTTDRCLGSKVATTIDDQGKHHKLIDFCYHVPGGLH